ncbi:MAG: hypothetical protein HUJ61_02580 [Bacilli bacterium]|nr:hypothetical protein [Bacilli bacterium]
MSKVLRGVEHQKLQSIANNYNYSLKRVRDIEKHFKDSKIKDELMEFYVFYIESVQKVFREFDPLEKDILEKEYFTPLDKNWWMTSFSRATFYRIRLNITRRFLDSFNA